MRAADRQSNGEDNEEEEDDVNVWLHSWNLPPDLSRRFQVADDVRSPMLGH
jgi:hypothetical protein